MMGKISRMLMKMRWMLNQMIRVLVLLAFFLGTQGLVVAQNPTQLQLPKKTITQYLVDQFLNSKVTYEVKSGLLKKKVKEIKGAVSEIIIQKDQFMLGLEKGDRLFVQFHSDVTVLESELLRRRGNFQQTSPELQMQVLKAHEFINASLASLAVSGSGGFSAGGGTSQSDLLDFSSFQNNAINFDQLEDILYTDGKGDKIKKGKAYATIEGVYLHNGVPLQVNLVSEDFHEEK